MKILLLLALTIHISLIVEKVIWPRSNFVQFALFSANLKPLFANSQLQAFAIIHADLEIQTSEFKVQKLPRIRAEKIPRRRRRRW